MQDLIPKRRGNPALVPGAPSLNPAGRPRRPPSLAAAMRARFSPERIVELAGQLAESAESEQVRLAALQLIADRAHGKSTDRVEHVMGTPDDDEDYEDLSSYTPPQLRALLDAERRYEEERAAIVASTATLALMDGT